MKSKTAVILLGLTIIGAGIAAGFSAPFGTIRYAGPVEVRVKETLSGTEYYTTGRYATIGAALAAITDASSSKPYVIFLPPGTYDLGSTQLVMKSYVDLVGSGQDTTTITCACAGTTSLDETGATIAITANNSRLRDFTVKNSGGDDYGSAIYANGAAATIENVTASAYGATLQSFGVYLRDTTSTLRDVTASGAGGLQGTGIYITAMAEPTLDGINATGSNGSSGSFGIINTDLSNTTVGNATVSAFNGTQTNTGISNALGATLDLTDAEVMATGGSVGAFAISNVGTVTLTRVDASASGGTTNYGAYHGSGTQSLFVEDSVLSGATNSVYTYDSSFTTVISHSVLVGPNNAGSGSWTCVNSSDGFTNLFDEDCRVRTVRVSKGTAISTINGALTMIANDLPAPSATLRYTVLVGPGTFSEQVVMLNYVDITGSGEDLTTITCACGSVTFMDTDSSGATVDTAQNSALRSLKVINTGGSTYNAAVRVISSPLVVDGVTVESSGSSSWNVGVYAYGFGAYPDLSNITATATGGTNSFGMVNDGGASPTMTDIHTEGWSGSYADGVVNLNSSPTMTNVYALGIDGAVDSNGIVNLTGSNPTIVGVTAIGNGASNSNHAHGIYNSDSDPEIRDSTIIAEGATGGVLPFNVGVRNVGTSAPDIYDSTIEAYDGTDTIGVWANANMTLTDVDINVPSGGSLWGIYNGGATVYVDHSRISVGTPGSNYAVYHVSSGWLVAGNSGFDGLIGGSGGFVCAESYNMAVGGYGALDASCAGGGTLLPPADEEPAPPAPTEPPTLPAPGE